MGETAESITELYREHTQLAEPSEELVAQLLALLEPDEAVLFTCGWTDHSEKWGPLAQLTVTTGRIIDQHWAGPGEVSEPLTIALGDVLAAVERPHGAGGPFATHALVVALNNGATAEWEHLTNEQIAPAAEAIEGARDAPI